MGPSESPWSPWMDATVAMAGANERSRRGQLKPS